VLGKVSTISELASAAVVLVNVTVVVPGEPDCDQAPSPSLAALAALLLTKTASKRIQVRDMTGRIFCSVFLRFDLFRQDILL